MLQQVVVASPELATVVGGYDGAFGVGEELPVPREELLVLSKSYY